MAGNASKENGKKGGRPIGSKSASTLEKEKVLAEVRQRIMRKADRLLDAQSSIAQGQQFLYKIEKTKVTGPKGGITYRNERPKLVDAQWEIQSYLDGLVEEGDMEDENDPAATYYFITTKEPNNMAIDSMLDRTFGRAVQYTDIRAGLSVEVEAPKEIKELTIILNGLYGGTSQSGDGGKPGSVGDQAHDKE